jgi:hypothetical protein
MCNVYMAANLLIKQYGNDAAIFAAQSVDSMAERGDLTGRALWMRVIDAIKELQSEEPPPGAQVH